MATSSYDVGRAGTEDYDVTGGGWITFAAILLGLAGTFNVLEGILAIANSRVYTAHQTFVFSDDPALAPPANGAPLRVRFQSARMRPDGTIDPTTLGPWRDYVVGRVEAFGIAHDRGNAFRFDVVVDASAGATVTVRELAVHYR